MCEKYTPLHPKWSGLTLPPPRGRYRYQPPTPTQTWFGPKSTEPHASFASLWPHWVRVPLVRCSHVGFPSADETGRGGASHFPRPFLQKESTPLFFLLDVPIFGQQRNCNGFTSELRAPKIPGWQNVRCNLAGVSRCRNRIALFAELRRHAAGYPAPLYL